jgi:hypothetical protein
MPEGVVIEPLQIPTLSILSAEGSNGHLASFMPGDCRPLIPPEQLLRGLLLQAFYAVLEQYQQSLGDRGAHCRILRTVPHSTLSAKLKDHLGAEETPITPLVVASSLPMPYAPCPSANTGHKAPGRPFLPYAFV